MSYRSKGYTCCVCGNTHHMTGYRGKVYCMRHYKQMYNFGHISHVGLGPRGFENHEPSKLKELSRRAGIASHVLGRAHRFTSEEARAARLSRRSPQPIPEEQFVPSASSAV